jgi:hypothetical protein
LYVRCDIAALFHGCICCAKDSSATGELLVTVVLCARSSAHETSPAIGRFSPQPVAQKLQRITAVFFLSLSLSVPFLAASSVPPPSVSRSEFSTVAFEEEAVYEWSAVHSVDISSTYRIIALTVQCSLPKVNSVQLFGL